MVVHATSYTGKMSYIHVSNEGKLTFSHCNASLARAIPDETSESYNGELR